MVEGEMWKRKKRGCRRDGAGQKREEREKGREQKFDKVG
jgi:hypothetical protein